MLAGWGGVLWYGGQIALAGRIRHPQARVSMAELQRGLDLHYHGLGGALVRHTVGDAGLQRNHGRGALFSSGVHDLMAWIDPQQVHLPRSVDRYPTAALNRELLFWLAAFMAIDEPLAGAAALPAGVRHLLRGVATSARVARAYPGLGERQARLCAAELAERTRVLPGWGLYLRSDKDGHGAGLTHPEFSRVTPGRVEHKSSLPLAMVAAILRVEQSK